MQGLNLIILFLLTYMITGCWSSDSVDSNKVEAETLHMDYSADFDQGTNRTKLMAQFRVGGPTGTTVRLAKPSSIVADDQSLNLVDGDDAAFNVIGSYYTLEDLPMHPSYRFKFKDSQARVREDELIIPQSVEVTSPTAIDMINLDDGATVTCVSSVPLEENEKLEIELSGEQKVKDEYFPTNAIVYLKDSMVASFSPEKLRLLSIDKPIHLTIRRVRTDRVTDPATGQVAILSSSFKTKPLLLKAKRS